MQRSLVPEGFRLMMRILQRALLVLVMISTGSALYGQTPAPSATPDAQVSLTIWIPDELALGDMSVAMEVLQALTDEFAQAEGVEIKLRLRRVSDAGGVLATLRTASNVAPGALPDLTLLRRQDLLAAQRTGLIQSLEGALNSGVLADMNSALRLGQVNNVLYGAPYLLDVQSLLVRLPRGTNLAAEWTYEAMLEREQGLVFPAARVGGLNDLAYMQALADGAVLTEERTLEFEPAALDRMLDFYVRGLENGIISADVLNYSSSVEYLEAFSLGIFDSGLFNSNRALRLMAQDERLHLAPVPSAQGEMLGLLNGWSWVLVSADSQRREVAMRYLRWMLEAENQHVYAMAAQSIPSQRSAMLRGLTANVDANLILEMVAGAVLPLEGDGGPAGRALQESLAALLTGQMDKQEAITAILGQQQD